MRNSDWSSDVCSSYHSGGQIGQRFQSDKRALDQRCPRTDIGTAAGKLVPEILGFRQGRFGIERLGNRFVRRLMRQREHLALAFGHAEARRGVLSARLEERKSTRLNSSH